MRAAPGALLVLLLAGPALAVPPPAGEGGDAGESFIERVVAARRAAGAQYAEMRSERREALRTAAREVMAGSEGVPGWRGADASGSAPSALEAEEGSTSRVFTVAGVVIAYLYLRIRFPWIFEVLGYWLWRRHRERRKSKVVETGQSTGPMVVRLKQGKAKG